jgi:hypothetical protein
MTRDCRTCGKPLYNDWHISGDCMTCRQIHDYVPDCPLFCRWCDSWSVNAYGCFNHECEDFSPRAKSENRSD